MTARDHMRRVVDGSFERTITPHSDAVEMVLADMKEKISHRLILPGEDGAFARVMLAIYEAAGRSMAKECDAGLSTETMSVVLTGVLGQLVASEAMRVTYSAPPAARFAMLSALLNNLCACASESLGRIDRMGADEVSGVVVPPLKPMARG